jgi:glucan 1,3-beta-glucosidase
VERRHDGLRAASERYVPPPCFPLHALLLRAGPGYATGARYDRSLAGAPVRGSCAESRGPVGGWSRRFRDETRRFIEAQLDAFEGGAEGWVFWTAKTEGAGEWDLLALLEHGVFPDPVTARMFPVLC